MSDQIKHECGIALIRLLKPLDFYQKKYGTPCYGLNKLYLLMEKQHNRGQDGAGVANIKLDVPAGKRYISRYRSIAANPIQDIFDRINSKFAEVAQDTPDKLKDAQWLKENLAFTGELWVGHLRYGTYGKNNLEYCHPFLRQNNWKSRNLVLAGNFNLTNVDELFEQLVELGQHPKEKSDTVTMLEKIGHFLDEENSKLFKEYRAEGRDNHQISELIAENINISKILQESCKKWDGGYVVTGMLGHGDAFVMRDPSGIRPVYYYHDDEVAVVTSERPAIQTAFDVDRNEIKEIQPGHALVIKKNGKVSEPLITEPLERKSCSFERIYFSRGTDIDIYQERKNLGKSICPAVLKSIDHDIVNTVFSFIPNTAETAYYGMVEGINDYLNEVKERKIAELKDAKDQEGLKNILLMKPRLEKIAIKDAKLRTFITNDDARDDLVNHIYDVTYGALNKGEDNLVVIDDSIVRGTTLEQSILRILDRLGPKKIIVVSSAPQIRYPDCYGIDMAKLGDFIAFRAAIELLKDTLQENIIEDVYNKSIAQQGLPKEQIVNHVKDIYRSFTPEQISAKIAEILTPKGMRAEVEIIYQSLQGLHEACPNHLGDWYFSGDYPTPGGNRVVNQAYINYVEGKNIRAY
ncbi:TPA: amidophosphoribosyltransferase [Candidatus Poribacteria bacterium]|nr:amidophosphoribosyltransferase [Candidatus Poribacteria bacterium]